MNFVWEIMESFKNFAPETTPILMFSPRPRTRYRKKGIKYILWPLYAYKVLAPKPVERKLNLFQRTVLGFCRTGVCEPARIASYAYLDKELVQFILSELRHSGYIDKSNSLTKFGNDILRMEIDRRAEEIISAYVFQDPWQSRLWPRIIQKLEYADIEYEIGSSYPTLIIGSEGNSWRNRPFVKDPDSSMRPQAPTPVEILHASRRHERDKKIGFSAGIEYEMEDNSEYDFDPLLEFETPSFDRIAAIHVEPELYYVVTAIYIPEYEQINPDWLVWDPVGISSSPWLRKWIDNQTQIDSQLGSYLHKFMENSIVDKRKIKEGETYLVELAKTEVKQHLGSFAEDSPLFNLLT